MSTLSTLVAVVSLAGLFASARVADPCRMWAALDGTVLISNCAGTCAGDPAPTCGKIDTFDTLTGTTLSLCYCGEELSTEAACTTTLYTYANGSFLVDCKNESCNKHCYNPLLDETPRALCGCSQ